MIAFYLPNHSSQRLISVEMADLIKLEPKGHPTRWPDKKAMLAFAHDEATDHCFYHLSEPRDTTRRLNVKDNPVVKLHGVVADYDSKISPALMTEALGKVSADFPLAYYSKTFSGGARLVWQFERPISVVSPEIAKGLLKRLAKEMKLVKLLPGFDEGAFLDTSRVFELGHDWVPLHPDAVVPSTTLQRFLFDAAQKQTFAEQGTEIPIDDVAAEVEHRWPHRWQGPFTVGAQGVRFWDPKADCPHGCWIRENGVVAFTGEGRFLPWEEILGKDFVSRYEADRVGGAIDGMYYDGRAYWIKNAAGNWDDYNMELARNLLISRGLRPSARVGQSEVDRAINHISFNCRVNGAFPRLFHDGDVYEMGGQKLLNISRVRAMSPADGVQEWGKNFPWIAKYLEGLFGREQLDVFLSWHHHFWWSAYRHQLAKGHAMFIAGAPGIGKTLLSLRILGASVGSHEEATDYLTSKESFNHSLMSSALWAIDDATALADRHGHDVYTQRVKRVVANPTLTYRRMYANPVTAVWLGRIVVTLNDDPVSIGMLPSTDGSILDKLIFLYATKPDIDFRDAEKKIREELPYYLGFLRDYEIPAKLKTQPEHVRFGLDAWKNPDLLREAKAGSGSAEFADILEIWKDQYFRVEDKATDWTGTATDLYSEMENTDVVKPLLRAQVRTPKGLSRFLSQLAADGTYNVSVAAQHSNCGRVFRIVK